MSSPQLKKKSGKYTGTGSALELTFDFDVAEIEIISTHGDIIAKKSYAMEEDNFLKCDFAGGAVTLVTADGITLGAAEERKVTVGADADINTADEVYYYTAWE